MLNYELKDPKYVVIIIHGAREHIHRYDDFANFLYNNNLAVYGIDHEGHGSNMIDNRVEFTDYDSLVNNQVKLIKQVMKQYPNKKVILFGHSLGSVYARLLLIQTDLEFDKVILSGLANPSNVQLKGGQFITKYMNPNKTSKLVHMAMFDMFKLLNNLHHNQGSWLSFNQENAERFEADVLCGGIFTNKAANIFLTNMLEAKAYDLIPKIDHLLISGAQDPVTDFTKSVDAYEKILVKYKINVKNIVYANMKHEVLFEANKDIVYQDILKFIMQ